MASDTKRDTASSDDTTDNTGAGGDDGNKDGADGGNDEKKNSGSEWRKEIETLNDEAVALMTKDWSGGLAEAMKKLQKAERMTVKPSADAKYIPDERVRVAMRATTFNNLSIWYKCDGEAKKAKFLKRDEAVNAPFEKDSAPTTRVVSHLLRANREKYAVERVTTFDEVKRTMTKAWNYANRALRLEMTLLPSNGHNHSNSDDDNNHDGVVAATHLNMCAILSSMGRHHGALQHAETALILLNGQIRTILRRNRRSSAAPASASTNGAVAKKTETKGTDDDNGDGDEEKEVDGDGDGDGGDDDSKQKSKDGGKGSTRDYGVDESILNLVCAAYHNIAVEQEFLHQLGAAAITYRRAQEFSLKYFGSKHRTSKLLNKSYVGAQTLHPRHVVPSDITNGASQHWQLQPGQPQHRLTIANVKHNKNAIIPVRPMIADREGTTIQLPPPSPSAASASASAATAPSVTITPAGATATATPTAGAASTSGTDDTKATVAATDGSTKKVDGASDGETKESGSSHASESDASISGSATGRHGVRWPDDPRYYHHHPHHVQHRGQPAAYGYGHGYGYGYGGPGHGHSYAYGAPSSDSDTGMYEDGTGAWQQRSYSALAGPPPPPSSAPSMAGPTRPISARTYTPLMSPTSLMMPRSIRGNNTAVGATAGVHPYLVPAPRPSNDSPSSHTGVMSRSIGAIRPKSAYVRTPGGNHGSSSDGGSGRDHKNPSHWYDLPAPPLRPQSAHPRRHYPAFVPPSTSYTPSSSATGHPATVGGHSPVPPPSRPLSSSSSVPSRPVSGRRVVNRSTPSPSPSPSLTASRSLVSTQPGSGLPATGLRTSSGDERETEWQSTTDLHLDDQARHDAAMERRRHQLRDQRRAMPIGPALAHDTEQARRHRVASRLASSLQYRAQPPPTHQHQHQHQHQHLSQPMTHDMIIPVPRSAGSVSGAPQHTHHHGGANDGGDGDDMIPYDDGMVMAPDGRMVHQYDMSTAAPLMTPNTLNPRHLWRRSPQLPSWDEPVATLPHYTMHQQHVANQYQYPHAHASAYTPHPHPPLSSSHMITSNGDVIASSPPHVAVVQTGAASVDEGYWSDPGIARDDGDDDPASNAAINRTTLIGPGPAGGLSAMKPSVERGRIQRRATSTTPASTGNGANNDEKTSGDAGNGNDNDEQQSKEMRRSPSDSYLLLLPQHYTVSRTSSPAASPIHQPMATPSSAHSPALAPLPSSSSYAPVDHYGGTVDTNRRATDGYYMTPATGTGHMRAPIFTPTPPSYPSSQSQQQYHLHTAPHASSPSRAPPSPIYPYPAPSTTTGALKQLNNARTGNNGAAASSSIASPHSPSSSVASSADWNASAAATNVRVSNFTAQARMLNSS